MKKSHYPSKGISIAVVFLCCLLNWQCKSVIPIQQLVAEEILPTYWPGKTPDHIILNMTVDPTSSIAVSWRTSTAVTKGYSEISIAGHGPRFPGAIQTDFATTEAVTSTEISANYHSVLISGLQSGETYMYRVGDERNRSEWIQVKMPEENKDFSFIYFGDAQNDIKSMWSRVIREAYSNLPDAAFMLHAGDLINRYNSDSDWHEWFEAGSFIHAMIPAVMTPGNHEYRKGKLSPQWQPQFMLPNNGPSGMKETCYYFDYNNMRVISLNSMAALKEGGNVEVQREWLKKVLEENTSKWIAVTLHHPLYATKAGRDNNLLREHFQPLFEEHNVDLVLQGHDHAYGRGHNVPIGSNTAAGSSQTVYVVSVSGPKMYELTAQDWMARKAKNTQLFQLITVDENVLRYEAYTARGDIYDAFEIVKDDAGSKEIIDHIPNIPERLE